ncbi:hypothetical protein PUN28_019938 [Cardiocondyla obscurior]|uniref:Uncharacterized protein n=1 Tax=Cardiocondyla obscurior TaxID=286306 RepID=A0AAW2EC89_9HYME
MVPDQPDRYTLFSRVPSRFLQLSISLCPSLDRSLSLSHPFYLISRSRSRTLPHPREREREKEKVRRPVCLPARRSNRLFYFISFLPASSPGRRFLVSRRINAETQDANKSRRRARARERETRESGVSRYRRLSSPSRLALGPALLSGYFSPRSFSRSGERRQEESSGCSFLTSPYNATRESIRAPASSLFPSLSLSFSPSPRTLVRSHSRLLSLAHRPPSALFYHLAPSFTRASLSRALSPSPTLRLGPPSLSDRPSLRDPPRRSSPPRARAHPSGSYTPLHRT